MDAFREIELRLVALQTIGGDVVCPRRHFRRGERAKPYSRLFFGLPNFGHPFPPVALPHAAVDRVARAAFFCRRGSGGVAW